MLSVLGDVGAAMVEREASSVAGPTVEGVVDASGWITRYVGLVGMIL